MSEYTPEMAHAVWLDEKCPGWESKIDLDRLNLDDAQVCMLGQTATCILGPRTDIDEARQRYGYWRVFDAEGWTMGGGPQQELGFDVPAGGTLYKNETLLTIAWRELIRGRLAVPA